MGMIKGITIELGGKALVVPPLSFNQLKTLQDDIDSLSGGLAGAKQMDTTLRIVQAAISRNYPETTIEELGDWIDLGNAAEVVLAVLGNSGYSATGSASAGEGGAPKK